MNNRLEVTAVAVIIAITAVTAAQTILRSVQLSALANRPKAPPVPCVGEPLAVDADYGGGAVKPWSCKPQCADQRRRYLTYNNGYATQCAPLPNCTDDGEDRGVTCTVPMESAVK